MKKLCLGSFAKVLVLCKKAQGVTQKRLVGTMLLTVAPEYDITTDDTAASNLIRCEDDLSPFVTDLFPIADVQGVADGFRQIVMPLLDDNKRASIILALKDIVASDTSIEDTTPVDIVGNTTKAALQNTDSFVLPDFLAGVFIYAITTTRNRDGKPSIREISDTYIASFLPQTETVSIIEQVASEQNAVAELSGRELLVTLLSESKGSCLNCGRPLGIPVDDQPIDYCEIHYLPLEDGKQNSYQNAVPVCPDCARKLRNASDEKNNELHAIKERMAQLTSTMESITKIDMESEIEDVIREISGIEDLNALARLETDAVEVDRKITDLPLLVKTRNFAIMYFYAVHNALARLAAENKISNDKLSRSIRRQFEDASERLSSQPDVNEALVNALFERVGRRHREACEIVIAYFVQRCDIFDAIT